MSDDLAAASLLARLSLILTAKPCVDVAAARKLSTATRPARGVIGPNTREDATRGIPPNNGRGFTLLNV